jgi:hypothetical protein
MYTAVDLGPWFILLCFIMAAGRAVPLALDHLAPPRPRRRGLDVPRRRRHLLPRRHHGTASPPRRRLPSFLHSPPSSTVVPRHQYGTASADGQIALHAATLSRRVVRTRGGAYRGCSPPVPAGPAGAADRGVDVQLRAGGPRRHLGARRRRRRARAAAHRLLHARRALPSPSPSPSPAPPKPSPRKPPPPCLAPRRWPTMWTVPTALPPPPLPVFSVLLDGSYPGFAIY